MFNPLNFLSKIIKSSNQKELARLHKIVNKVNDIEVDISKLEDSYFPKKTAEFIEKINKGTSLDNILPEEYCLKMYLYLFSQ
tara:strand:+ start:67 stop:312 length:246 start_codon:yes stop_codon:yes gene_type:complete